MSAPDAVINIIDEKFVVNIGDDIESDEFAQQWTEADVASGQITWADFLNSRWGDVYVENVFVTD